MDYVILGKSNLLVSRTAFGAMTLAGVDSQETAAALVKQAYDDGVNFFDTSVFSQESERRLGEAISSLGIRDDVVIATKTTSCNTDKIDEDINCSLCNLKVDYIDLYQLEVNQKLPRLDSTDRVAEKFMNLKSSGLIRHFGISTESLEIAKEMLSSDVPWETIQFPFNMLCPTEIENFVKEVAKSEIGFIAMRPLCGGIVSNIPLALGYLRQFENVVPVWGVENSEQLQQILYFTQNPPNIDEKFHAEVKEQRDFFN
ncbi:MAG: aldo/keto reductase [Treponema sp.]|nr:aldo/keto reductase [Treponema sp.]